MNNLIEEHEIVSLAKLRGTFPQCELRDITIIEWNLFENCLGHAFKKDLLANKTTHVADEYDDEKTYAIGEKAIFDQFIYEAIASTTGNRPDNIKYWKNATKFDEDLYNELWCQYLGPLIAYHVVKGGITQNSIYLSPQGAARRTGESFSPATTGEINLLIQNYDAKITMTLKAMIGWMTDQREDNNVTLFDNYSGFDGDCETENCVAKRRNKSYYRAG